MKVIRTLDAARTGQPTFVAIGCFDGVHLAHQKILNTVIAGKAAGLAPAVFTFDCDPDTAGKGMPLLMTTADKLCIFEEMGIELVFLMQFSDVRNITAEQFVTDVLGKKCGAKAVCCGYNFHFGQGGHANAADLRRMCAASAIQVSVVAEMDLLDLPVSSTRIRALLQAGRLEEANVLLGRPFSFSLPVIHGRKLGREIGVPTMNQKLPPDFVQPKRGVYCSETIVDGQRFASVTNIGVKPTVGGVPELGCETWIMGFSGNLYGKTVTVSLLHYLREEQKFSSLEALRDQILQDRLAAERLYYGSTGA